MLCECRTRNVPYAKFVFDTMGHIKKGLTGSEIADKLGMKASSFYVRISNVRKGIRENEMGLAASDRKKLLAGLTLPRKGKGGRRPIDRKFILKNALKLHS